MATFEVEMKFRLDGERDVVLRALEPYAAADRPTVVRQEDLYFAHPCRDFAKTDEAFRLRRVGEDRCLTYKGPLLDQVSKTRQEIEVGIASGDESQEKTVAMLESLGFSLVGRVAKLRETRSVHWSGLAIDVAFDQVDGLGNFVELETLADETSWEVARDQLLQFAKLLGLRAGVRSSYLELLLGRASV